MSTYVRTLKERTTDDTVYPVTKAGAVYMEDEESTVEGEIGALEDEISALNSNLSSYVATRTVTWGYSLTANGNANTNLYSLIEDSMPTGYRFLGVVGFTTGNVQVVPISVRYSDSVYSLQIRNLSSSAQTGTFTTYYSCGKF